MELRTVNTFLHIAELHSFSRARGSWAIRSRQYRRRSRSWKRSWRPRCSTEWGRPSG